MCDVELPHAQVHAKPCDHEAALVEHAAEHQARGIAGDQDEHLGRIGESERLNGEQRKDVAGDVINEDAEQGEASKKIESEVAPDRHRPAIAIHANDIRRERWAAPLPRFGHTATLAGA
jgi:hypothetical protein